MAELASCPSAQTPCQALPLNTRASASAWPYLAVCFWVPRKGKQAGFGSLGHRTFPVCAAEGAGGEGALVPGQLRPGGKGKAEKSRVA